MNTTGLCGVARAAAAASATCLTLLVAGCGGLPERIDTLETAREAVRSAEQDELASEFAATEIAAARTALAEADELFEDDADLTLIEHQAYLAQRYADIAEQRIAEAHAREEIAQAEANRNRVLLEARTREAEAAQREAQVAQQQAQTAEQQARAAQQRAQLTAEQAAAIARENQELMQSLEDLQARETERGVVLTLSDVLFDTAEAELKPGAMSAIDRLADFMREYPERSVRIEGHTDARGTEQFNRELSERRAAAVEEALLARGIERERVDAVGLGEDYPVASNETSAGMQQNRRVEIVVSNGGGEFGQVAAADRRAAVD
jgi:outer membrane protein OmpA-like peptidoglycan-associated protein